MNGRGRGVLEVLALWLGTLLLIRLVVVGVQAGLPELFTVASPLLFMYAPVLVCRLRGVPTDDYPLSVPAFRDWRGWGRGLVWGTVAALVLLSVWYPLYLLWWGQIWPAIVEGLGLHDPRRFGWRGSLPGDFPLRVLYHVMFVAIPEEMFYRGYVQSRLDEVFSPRLRVFGAQVGWGLVLTSVLFAFGHSVVLFQWWHFAIFLPSLVFGWMRARTGDILPGAFFHAWCNITVEALDSLYGLSS